MIQSTIAIVMALAALSAAVPLPVVRTHDDRIIVKPKHTSSSSSSGIIIPDTAREKPQRGEVIAVGPGRLVDTGKLVKLSLFKGQEVHLGKKT